MTTIMVKSENIDTDNLQQLLTDLAHPFDTIYDELCPQQVYQYAQIANNVEHFLTNGPSVVFQHHSCTTIHTLVPTPVPYPSFLSSTTINSTQIICQVSFSKAHSQPSALTSVHLQLTSPAGVHQQAASNQSYGGEAQAHQLTSNK